MDPVNRTQNLDFEPKTELELPYVGVRGHFHSLYGNKDIGMCLDML